MAATLGLGIVGLGTAGAAMLAAARRHERFRLVAVADPLVDALPLGRLAGTVAYPSLEALLDDPAVDVVHIATPTLLHATHVRLALDARRHVIVEKPVTADSGEVDSLIKAAADAGVAVVVGHSESFEPYVAAVRSAVASGGLGEVVAITAEKVTDWMRRPRRPDELDPRAGGGIVRRQGVHQIDVVRSLLPGEVFQVRSARLHEDRHRGAPAGYVAWLEAGLATALLVQDGSGVLTAPRVDAGAEIAKGRSPEDEKRRRASALVERAVASKGRLSIGGSDAERLAILGTAGRAVGSSDEVVIERAGEVEKVDLQRLPEGRAAVLDELLGALSGVAARHDLSWGGENLRLCEAIERVATR